MKKPKILIAEGDDIFSQPSLINRKIVSALGSNQPMIGDSMPMREIRSYLLKVAATDSPVLITGIGLLILLKGKEQA